MKKRHQIDLVCVENDASCSDLVRRIEQPDTPDLPDVFPQSFAAQGQPYACVHIGGVRVEAR